MTRTDLVTRPKGYALRLSEEEMRRYRADAKRAKRSFADHVRHCLEVVSRSPASHPRGADSAGVGKARVSPTRQVRVDDLQERPSTVRVTEVPSAMSFAEERDRARDLAQSMGRCTADVGKGLRCRLCGKIHP